MSRSTRRERASVSSTREPRSPRPMTRTVLMLRPERHRSTRCGLGLVSRGYRAPAYPQASAVLTRVGDRTRYVRKSPFAGVILRGLPRRVPSQHYDVIETGQEATTRTRKATHRPPRNHPRGENRGTPRAEMRSAPEVLRRSIRFDRKGELDGGPWRFSARTGRSFGPTARKR
jgi:hypothetical protein